MTRYRVPFCGLTVLAVAVSAAFDASGQEKRNARARMLNSNGSVVYSYCDSYALTAASDGSLEVNCATAAVIPGGSTPPPTTPPPTAPTGGWLPGGKIGFPSDTIPDTPQNQVIPVTIARLPVNTGGGAISTLLDVAYGPCVPARQTVGFSDQEGGTKVINLTATAQGRCGIRVVTLDAADTGFTSVFVNVIAPTANTPPPTQPPANTPPPTAAPGSCGANIYMQPMLTGGTNNYVFDSGNYTNTGRPNIDPGVTSPQGTIQSFELPRTRPFSGTAVMGGAISFSSYIFYSAQGVNFEVSLSKCKGDFETYKTQQLTNFGGITYTPCGGIKNSPDFNMGWAINAGAYNACNIPAGETWYMNWRPVPGTCPAGTGHTCGGTFTVDVGGA